MLLNNLYTVKESKYTVNESNQNISADFSLSFNPAHPIYSGHFPSNPITPGACLVQIALELLAQILKNNTNSPKPTAIQPKSITNLKFLAPHTPEQPLTVTVRSLDSSRYSAELTNGVEYYAKMTFHI